MLLSLLALSIVATTTILNLLYLPLLYILLLKYIKTIITINIMKAFEIAKGFLDILLNQMVDKTMVAAIKRE